MTTRTGGGGLTITKARAPAAPVTATPTTSKPLQAQEVKRAPEKLADPSNPVPEWLDIKKLAATVPPELLKPRPKPAFYPRTKFVSGDNAHAPTEIICTKPKDGTSNDSSQAKQHDDYDSD